MRFVNLLGCANLCLLPLILILADKRPWLNVVLIFAHCRRRWPNIKKTLTKLLVIPVESDSYFNYSRGSHAESRFFSCPDSIVNFRSAPATPYLCWFPTSGSGMTFSSVSPRELPVNKFRRRAWHPGSAPHARLARLAVYPAMLSIIWKLKYIFPFYKNVMTLIYNWKIVSLKDEETELTDFFWCIMYTACKYENSFLL